MFGSFAFFTVSAFLEDALGEHAEVAADRNSGGGDGADFFRLAGSAFELYGIGAGCDEAAGGGECLAGSIVGVYRKVRDDEGGRAGAGDGGEVMENVIESDVGGVRESEDDHAEGIADEEKIDAGLIEKAGGGVVVAGEGGDGIEALPKGDCGGLFLGSHF